MGRRTGDAGIRWEENRRGRDKMGRRTGDEEIKQSREQERKG